MEYTIVDASSPQDLADDVEELLGEGWQLYGYPYAATYPPPNGSSSYQAGRIWHYQAMIKYDSAHDEMRQAIRAHGT